MGAGAGGNLTITASESASFAGLGSGLFSTASSTGAAGQITLSTPTLTMADGGAISVATEGVGAAGNISLSVNNLNLAGGSQVLSSTTGDGAGGTVAVTAGGLVSITGSGSGLFSTASSTGNAGQITASTPTLTIVDGGAISVATSGAGNAGNGLLNVSNLSLSGGAQIVSSTSGAGQGGSVSAKATDSVSISGPGTGLFSTASGTGPGGTINIQTAQLQITDAAVVSANSTGSVSATAGNINVVFGNTLRMENSSITTEALVADGGNISITSAASLLHMTNSQVTTSVQSGLGQGGNISIGSGLHPLDFILLNNSGIHANAFGGSGGNINIFADTFLSSLPITTAVTASSNLSTSGTIDIQASIVDVSGEISQLPEAPLQATELLRATCAARLAAGKSSSLVLGGRGGLPLEPGGLLPSPLYVAAASAISSGSRLLSGGQTASASVLGSGNEQGQLRTGWNQFQLAKIALGLGCSQ
jgi:large exoprotein involved in heme utilization and adhesion